MAEAHAVSGRVFQGLALLGRWGIGFRVLFFLFLFFWEGGGGGRCRVWDLGFRTHKSTERSQRGLHGHLQRGYYVESQSRGSVGCVASGVPIVDGRNLAAKAQHRKFIEEASTILKFQGPK